MQPDDPDPDPDPTDIQNLRLRRASSVLDEAGADWRQTLRKIRRTVNKPEAKLFLFINTIGAIVNGSYPLTFV